MSKSLSVSVVCGEGRCLFEAAALGRPVTALKRDARGLPTRKPPGNKRGRKVVGRTSKGFNASVYSPVKQNKKEPACFEALSPDTPVGSLAPRKRPVKPGVGFTGARNARF